MIVDTLTTNRTKRGRRVRHSAPSIEAASATGRKLASRHPLAMAALALALTAAATAPLSACPYSIREAGFVVQDRHPYRLAVIVSDDDPGHQRLKEWVTSAGERGGGLPPFLDTEVIRSGWPVPAPLRRYEAGLRPLKAPALCLLTPRREVIPLAEGDAVPTSAEEVDALIAAIAESPMRRQLQTRLIDDWAVVLLLPAEEQGGAARAAVDKAADRIVGTFTELGHKIEHRPRVIDMTAERARERILMQTVGLDPDRRDVPQAAVLFGKGRRIGPVLRGADLTENAVNQIFVMLGRSCACTTDPRWLIGPSFPGEWTQTHREAMHRRLGFDPDSPRVAMSISSVWTTTTLDDDDSPLDFTPRHGVAGGYREFAFEDFLEDDDFDYETGRPMPPPDDLGSLFDDAVHEPAPTRPAADEPSVLPGRRAMFAVVGVFLGALAVVGVVGMVVFALKRRPR